MIRITAASQDAGSVAWDMALEEVKVVVLQLAANLLLLLAIEAARLRR